MKRAWRSIPVADASVRILIRNGLRPRSSGGAIVSRPNGGIVRAPRRPPDPPEPAAPTVQDRHSRCLGAPRDGGSRGLQARSEGDPGTCIVMPERFRNFFRIFSWSCEHVSS